MNRSRLYALCTIAIVYAVLCAFGIGYWERSTGRTLYGLEIALPTIIMLPWLLFLRINRDRLLTAIVLLTTGVIASYIGTDLVPGRQVGIEMALAISLIYGGVNLAILIVIFAIASAVGSPTSRTIDNGA